MTPDAKEKNSFLLFLGQFSTPKMASGEEGVGVSHDASVTQGAREEDATDPDRTGRARRR